MSQSNTFVCPRCRGPVQDKGNSPGGGTLIVVEETDTCSDGYDCEISEFHCAACDDSFFIRPQFGIKKTPAEQAAQTDAFARNAATELFAKAGLDFNTMMPDPKRPGLWIPKT